MYIYMHVGIPGMQCTMYIVQCTCLVHAHSNIHVKCVFHRSRTCLHSAFPLMLCIILSVCFKFCYLSNAMLCGISGKEEFTGTEWRGGERERERESSRVSEDENKLKVECL